MKCVGLIEISIKSSLMKIGFKDHVFTLDKVYILYAIVRLSIHMNTHLATTFSLYVTNETLTTSVFNMVNQI